MRRAYHTIFTLTFLTLGAAAWLLPLKPAAVAEAAPVDQSLLRRQSISFYETASPRTRRVPSTWRSWRHS